MAYLTENQLANIIDVPIALGATTLDMGDWLILGSVIVAQPMRLTCHLLDLQMISSTVNNSLIDPTSLIYGNLGLVYVVLAQNYASGSPGSITGLDTVVAYDIGHWDRNIAAPVFITTPGTYTWLIANNTQPSTVANPAIPQGTSINFEVAVTGTARLELSYLT
jgi:hypothetical protein